MISRIPSGTAGRIPQHADGVVRCCNIDIRRFLQDRRANVAPIFALAIIPAARPDRRRRRLQPRQQGPDLDAGGDRRHRAGAWHRTPARLTADQLKTKAQDYFIALFKSGEATNIKIHDRLLTTNGFQLKITGTGTVKSEFMNSARHQHHPDRHVVDDDLGQYAPARRARARQHRIDGRRRQDGGAEDRHQEPADAAEERRRHQRRRLCLDHSRSART